MNIQHYGYNDRCLNYMALRAMCKYSTLLTVCLRYYYQYEAKCLTYVPQHTAVRVSIFPIVVCVRSDYVISAGVGFRVESSAVVLLQLDL